jgi:hypothetical protein
MRIVNSSVSLYGNSSSVETHTKEESLKMWTGNTRPVFEGENPPAAGAAAEESPVKDILQISEEGRKAFESKIAKSAGCGICTDDEDLLAISDKDKQKIYLLQLMIEALTGKRLKFSMPKKVNSGGNDSVAAPAQTVAKQGWGLEYDLHETHYEKQAMSFSANGSVKTADGREINFDLVLNMSREFASRLDVSVRAGDAVPVDPLVINFASSSAALTNQKFSFDIDSDGKQDQISFVAPGSGFLAFDINNDGIINNGHELFGPQSGNGFSELAQYDNDNNGWIDENDDIYDKLRIWTKDENGNDKLFALGEKGIGAIFLGSTETAFDLKSSSNDTLGSIARSGVFLRENGTAGTIQHVDLVV